jgi:hypothetical protein
MSVVALLRMIDSLIKVVFPPPGGTQRRVDQEFARLVSQLEE